MTQLEKMPEESDLAPSPDMDSMRSAACEAASMMRALGNPDRLMLMCQLSQGEFSVGELEGLVGLRQPSLSQQLGVLRHERLVSTRREGKRIFYSIADPRMHEVLETLYRLYCPNGGQH